MGSAKWHVARAKRNYEACEFNRDEFPEWAGVALFYSALHYVDAALADERHLNKDERNPRKHVGHEPSARGRNQIVAAEYPEIAVEYASLYEMSRRSRYDLGRLSESLDDGQVLTLFIGQWETIKRFCTNRRASHGSTTA
jgi:hypothetical protein